MRSYLSILFCLMALAGCAKKPPTLCAPMHSSCPVIIKYNTYWESVPTDLAPDEAVVVAKEISSDAVTLGTPWVDYEDVMGFRRTYSCVAVQPGVMREFSVESVVAGTFKESRFFILDQPRGCGQDYTVSTTFDQPQDGKTAYLVIRPAPLLSPMGATPGTWIFGSECDTDRWTAASNSQYLVVDYRPEGATPRSLRENDADPDYLRWEQAARLRLFEAWRNAVLMQCQ